VAGCATGWALWLIATRQDVLAEPFEVAAVGLLDLAGFFAFAAVGAMVAVRRHRNAIGWLFLTLGLAFTLQEAAGQYAGRAYADPTGLPAGSLAVVADWASSWSWALAVAALPAALLLFPDGRPPSARWRWVGWLNAVTAGALIPVIAAGLWTMRSPTARVADQPDEGLLLVALIAFVAIHGVCLLAAGASLAVRFRRARGIERQQLRWIAWAGGALIAALFTGALDDLVGAPALGVLAEVGGGLAVIALPVAVGMAVLRYRLYEIDRIISRTFSWALLSMFLGGIYLVTVLVVAPLVGQGSDLIVAASTLAVAAAFGPARRRVQGFVDRRFNRARYDAEQTIVAFRAQLRDEVALEYLSREVLAVVHRTVEPAGASLWLREMHR
jgi:hypothetical protein